MKDYLQLDDHFIGELVGMNGMALPWSSPTRCAQHHIHAVTRWGVVESEVTNLKDGFDAS